MALRSDDDSGILRYLREWLIFLGELEFGSPKSSQVSASWLLSCKFKEWNSLITQNEFYREVYYRFTVRREGGGERDKVPLSCYLEAFKGLMEDCSEAQGIGKGMRWSVQLSPQSGSRWSSQFQWNRYIELSAEVFIQERTKNQKLSLGILGSSKDTLRTVALGSLPHLICFLFLSMKPILLAGNIFSVEDKWTHSRCGCHVYLASEDVLFPVFTS